MSQKLNIVMMKIDDIKEYENNPRNNSKGIEAVCNSIRSFGFKVPIIIDKNNVIVAGHTRVAASRKLGLTEVPCIIADDLNDDQIRAFRIADNKVAELSSFNLDKLSEELQFIEMDMAQFGFDDLDKLLKREAMEDEFDENEELPENPYSKTGDIFILGNHRLMVGDSTKVEDVEKLMDGKKADMVFTDPPYNVDYQSANGLKIQNDKMKDDEFYNFLLSAFKNLYGSLKEGAALYITHADTEALNFRLAIKNSGFKLSEGLVWCKPSATFSRNDYHFSHESISYCFKPGKAHYFIDDHTLTTVWNFQKGTGSLHPTMKPIELVAFAIKNSSRNNELVLDLFGGSGSTMIAAEQINRRAYLMEIDPKYADVIVKRYLRFIQKCDGCYLIRDGQKIELNEITEYRIEIAD